MRNPKRTAATASALTIGVALVVLMTVFAASVRASIDHNVDTNLRSDWVIAPLQQDGLSPTVAQQVDALPETASTTAIRYHAGHASTARRVQVTGIDPATVERHLDVGVQAGSVGALGARGLGVRQRTATENGWHVGDDVTVTFADTGVQHFTVAMIYDLNDPLGDYAISQQAFDANVAACKRRGGVRARRAGRVEARRARVAIERALVDTPTARLHTPAEFKADVASRIDKLLNLDLRAAVPRGRDLAVRHREHLGAVGRRAAA